MKAIMKKGIEYLVRGLIYLPAPYLTMLAIPFRHKARNTVQRYCLQNKVYIKRLAERSPTWIEAHWCYLLKDVNSVEVMNGRKVEGAIFSSSPVSKMQFFFAMLVWLWLDDDSNEDTTDAGYVNTIKVGLGGWRVGESDRSKGVLNFLYGRFLPEYKPGDILYGNTFDLGDVRASDPHFNFWSAWIWARRNRAMNLKYFFFNY